MFFGCSSVRVNFSLSLNSKKTTIDCNVIREGIVFFFNVKLRRYAALHYSRFKALCGFVSVFMPSESFAVGRSSWCLIRT